jgi:hypothetical protein
MVLCHGQRGLPGGSSLARLRLADLMDRDDVPGRFPVAFDPQLARLWYATFEVHQHNEPEPVVLQTAGGNACASNLFLLGALLDSVRMAR